MKRKRLIDSKIRFEVKGTASVIARTSVKTPTHTKFHNILTEYLSYRADTDNRTIVHKIRDNALHTENNVMNLKCSTTAEQNSKRPKQSSR